MEHDNDNTLPPSEPIEQDEPKGQADPPKKRSAPRRKPKLFSLAKTPTGARKPTDPVQVGVQRTYSLFDLGLFKPQPIKEEPQDGSGDDQLRSEGTHEFPVSPHRDTKTKKTDEIGIFCAACNFSLGSWEHAKRCLCYCDDLHEKLAEHAHQDLAYDGPETCPFCLRSRFSYPPSRLHKCKCWKPECDINCVIELDKLKHYSNCTCGRRDCNGCLRPNDLEATSEGEAAEIHEVVSDLSEAEQPEEPSHQGSDDDEDQGQVRDCLDLSIAILATITLIHTLILL